MTAKQRQRLPRRVREQQIIDAAVQVFSKRGYHAAVVDEISELAGISKPMVYLYLGSKEGLFIACIRRESERLRSAFREAAEAGGDSPETRLWAGLRAFFAFVTEHRDSWVVLYRQASELGDVIAAEVVQARRSVTDEVVALVRAGIAEREDSRLGGKDAGFVGHVLVGAADSLTDWMERHPEEDADRVALRLMNIVWVGMRQVLDGETWAPPAGP
ncbi:TetR/AcrR family transcriptional regulator [Streptomyces aidingensis]|uniref:DNA-binding transcriptional regulator, AcrR family n=1 Tax=Streptomyces aidingensis TaxID=910347 RepID=A0A1I1K1W3_9ACTN|nr:TetR/AcrR family transcriptional regulator [Streptomyces aidingensis]SFC54736.1 DNA-binding transcriptional regulator, AcrR family [Streptomyces aidingensis]